MSLRVRTREEWEAYMDGQKALLCFLEDMRSRDIDALDMARASFELARRVGYREPDWRSAVEDFEDEDRETLRRRTWWPKEP